ncbi:MAG: nucleotidyltransferase domain-containing protein [Lachnospiraceae bacterium]|nr:nucleotidyltransferase domain-containing protein [Lachnospiraceae bacterium]
MLEIRAIRDIVTPIAKEYGLKRIYLFGSYAKSTANEDSDIDLLIEKGRALTLIDLSYFRQAVEEKIGISVDVVTISGVADDFFNAVKGTEILLYEE